MAKKAQTKKTKVSVRDMKPKKNVKGGMTSKIPPAGSLSVPRMKWE